MKKDRDIRVPRRLGISEGRLYKPIACESGARDAMVENPAGGAVAAGRENGRGRGTDEHADLTVSQEPVCSMVGQVGDKTRDLMGWRV